MSRFATPGAQSDAFMREAACAHVSACCDADPPRRWRPWLTAAIIALLPAIVFINVWRSGGPATGLDDLIYYLPVRAWIGQELRAGRLPMWNPHVSLGTPLAADPQAGLWYPFTWLFVALPPLAAYSLNIYVHYVLAGWGMYRFLRALGRVWPAAMLGAVAFEFSPYLLAHREHLTILQAVAWIPWMLLAWQRHAQKSREPEAKNPKPITESRKPKTESQKPKGESDEPKAAQGSSLIIRHPSVVTHLASGYLFLAAAVWGLQLLTQHIQPSIMTAAVVGGYVLFVLRPMRPGILTAWLAVTACGGLLAAIQLIPTWYLYAGSGRGSAAYHLFIENSWVLSSALLFLFPMLFGNSRPSLWSEPWWGMSHLSEQWPYATLTILLLALASAGLLRQRAAGQRWRRELLFWWCASGIALVIALGDATPLSRLLFHIPVYRNLRVPARWILVWSLAFPVLASLVVHLVLSGREHAERVRRSIAYCATRVLPGLILLALVVMFIASWWARRWGYLLGNSHARSMLVGLGTALRILNPAIVIPLGLSGVTAAALVLWTRRPCPIRTAVVAGVFLLDLAIVAPFVAIDTQTYRRGDILEPPALARAISAARPDPGHRLLVPRDLASYERPLELLWPQTNLLHGVPTLNGYGPLGDLAGRVLLRVMPWGSSEAMLAILRNRSLLERLGVRFIAVRSDRERALWDHACWPEIREPRWHTLSGPDPQSVGRKQGVLWPVRMDTPGIYQLELNATPVEGSASRWFVRLESSDHHQELALTQAIEPADLACGSRRMRFLFVCTQTPGDAFVRVKSETGQAVRVSHARFACIAVPATATTAAQAEAIASPTGPLVELPGDVQLYEPGEPQPLIWTPRRVEKASGLCDAVEWLLGPAGAASPSTTAIAEGLDAERETPVPTSLKYQVECPERIRVDINAPTDQLIILNQTYNTGWRAFVDGKATAIQRVNALVQGVWVPPGTHQVVFEYRTPGLLIGILLSGGAWVCLALGAVTVIRPSPGVE